MRPTVGFLLVLFAATLAAQPPKIVPPDKATLETIQARAQKLQNALEALQKLGVREPALADIEIFLKAARAMVHHGEFFGKSAEWVLPVLDQGLLRASQAARGDTPWFYSPGQTVVRAYRSRIDGSVQPYAVTYPHDYGTVAGKRYRMDVELHGRQPSLTEVSFLRSHGGAKSAPKDLSYVHIEIYGRGNIAYRWAGEVDVVEAVEHFLATEAFVDKARFLDPRKVVLRGFSMGGAGTWHIGLHRPDQFALLGPGAGFTTTHGYVTDLPAKLPEYQEKCLRIYDAVDYAENAFNVPIVAYSGAEDKQIAAARNIEAKLKTLGLSMTHLVAPKLEHKFPDEWKAKAEAEYAKHLANERPEYPAKVRFVTYTLKYPSCYWVDLLALNQHYEQARVEAESKGEDGFVVQTTNVRSLRLGLRKSATDTPVTVVIDGQKLESVRPARAASGELSLYLEKSKDGWASVLPQRLLTDRLRSPQKTNGLQGPIDDAFMAPFLCVHGTGKPWYEATQEYAKANLERFRDEWAKYLRGDLPIKDDIDVTAEDMATKHLILFGDPASNSLLAQVVGKLPLTWTQKSITFAGKEYDASKHVPVMIYPSPLALDRYVVLNSGHTFHAADFAKTNAMLYPRLGDHAILALRGEKKDPLAVEVKMAGLFDDHWRLSVR